MKTEIVLPPNLALKVRAGSFLNPHGGVGKNKAADIHKENQVKALKDLIKGLGANKTQKSIIAVTKAAPTIDNIVQSFDEMLENKTFKTSHKKRSKECDVQCLLQTLQCLKPWRKQNRALKAFPNVKKTPFTFDSEVFCKQVLNTADRLFRDLPCDDSEESDAE